jgi:hypothetical protein
VLEVNGVPLRDLLIAHAGLKVRNRETVDGRRTQVSDSVFLSRPRKELSRTLGGSVIVYSVGGAYTHVPRREYGPRDEPLLDKFMRKVDQNPDGHWYWTGHLTRQGYGRFSLKVDGKYKTVGAHRWIYEAMVRLLEPDEVVDHRNDICGIRNCVNPSHLEAVSPEENARRGRVKLSLAHRTVCNNKHVLAEVGTRIDERGTVICKQCERDKVVRSRDNFYIRRAQICYEQGLEFIQCEDGHRLDLDGALSKNGTCRECNRLYAQSQRDRKKQAVG